MRKISNEDQFREDICPLFRNVLFYLKERISMDMIPHELIELSPKKLLFKYAGNLYELNKVPILEDNDD